MTSGSEVELLIAPTYCNTLILKQEKNSKHVGAPYILSA